MKKLGASLRHGSEPRSTRLSACLIVAALLTSALLNACDNDDNNVANLISLGFAFGVLATGGIFLSFIDVWMGLIGKIDQDELDAIHMAEAPQPAAEFAVTRTERLPSANREPNVGTRP